jgi:hypothetical protein
VVNTGEQIYPILPKGKNNHFPKTLHPISDAPRHSKTALSEKIRKYLNYTRVFNSLNRRKLAPENLLAKGVLTFCMSLTTYLFYF